MRIQKLPLLLLALLLAAPLWAEDGYETWLRYRPIEDTALRDTYRAAFTEIVLHEDLTDPILQSAAEVLVRFGSQIEHAKLWRDSINQYFYKRSGIPSQPWPAGG